jgi:hypothetical protein
MVTKGVEYIELFRLCLDIQTINSFCVFVVDHSELSIRDETS